MAPTPPPQSDTPSSVSSPARAARVAIAGATGLVGSEALFALDDAGATILCVGRRAPPRTNERITVSVDGLKPPAVDRAVAAFAEGGPLDAGLCALGTTMKQAGGKDAFRAVDFNAVVDFATACKAAGARRFVLVSSLGADARSRAFYTRVKGEAEEAVKALGFDAVAILRPSILDDAGRRDAEQGGRLGEKLGLVFMRGVSAVLGTHGRYSPIGVAVVGRAAARLALGQAPLLGTRVILSDALHALGA